MNGKINCLMIYAPDFTIFTQFSSNDVLMKGLVLVKRWLAGSSLSLLSQ